LRALKQALEKKMDLVNRQIRKWDKALDHVKRTLPKHKGAQDFFAKMNMALNHIEVASKKEKLESLKKA
jgi:hypothetical protein